MCFSIEQLDRYVENNADEELRKAIEEHLTTCRDCSNEVKERSLFKKFLIHNLGRPDTPHPDFEDIEAFYHNKLAKEKEKEVAGHLIWCDDCRESLDIIKEDPSLEELSIPALLEVPKKLSPKLKAHFIKNMIQEIALEVVRKRFPDKKEFFNNLWDRLLSIPGMAFPKKSNLIGAFGFSESEPDAPEYQILSVIKTLEDFTKKAAEQENFKTIAKRIRSSAKKNRVKPDLVDDLIEFSKSYF